MLLYKYQTIDDFFWINLRKSSLWFQNPFEFDDDFEARLPLDTNYSEFELEVWFRVSYLLNFKTQENFNLHFGQAIEFLKNNPEERKKFFYGLIEDQTKNRMAISCFTQDEKDTVLWRYYAENGSGVCFKFDTLEDEKFFETILPVKYYKQLPKIKLNVNNIADDLKRFYTCKRDYWEKQKELRLFRKKKGLYKYNPQSLKEIIFGVRADINDIEKVISIALQLNPKIDFYKLSIGDGDYNKEKI